MRQRVAIVLSVCLALGAACSSAEKERAKTEEPTQQTEKKAKKAKEKRAKEAQTKVGEVMTKAVQASLTPDDALEKLEEGNERFVEGERIERDYPAQVKATAAGQYPFAAVLGCIDSRVPAETVFDQGVGDIFTARVAGNFVNTDMLGSLEFATKVAGAKLIVVMGHTDCGAVEGACDDVELGNVSALVSELRPSVEAVTPEGETCSSDNDVLVNDIAEHNVQRTIDEIRQKSDIISQLEKEGTIRIVGAMYDVATGEVTFI